MLNQKICFVDFAEQAFTVNSIYAEPMPKAQLDMLYLAAALALRPNRITVISDRPEAVTEAQIQFLPLPQDPAGFWSSCDYDAVVCLDSLEAVSQISPWLSPEVALMLWSHLAPRHVAMLPLQHASVRGAWGNFVFDSFYLGTNYCELYQLPVQRCHYRWPAMVRTLRKRFTGIEQFKAKHAPAPTMVFTAGPAYGLAQALESYSLLRAEFAQLQLWVLLKPGSSEADESPASQGLLQTCRDTPGVKVFDPMPWPAYVEKLVSAHVLCHPLAFQDLGCSELIDPLSAGCRAVLCAHPGLQEILEDQPDWIPADPAASYFDRYTEGLGAALRQLQEDPDLFYRRSFGQMARFSTFNTWDLRVWEWEALFYSLQHETDRLFHEPPPVEKI